MAAFTLSFLLLLALRVTNGYVCNGFDSTLCLEPRCIQTAANILRVMDLDADPCQDFYQFACGNYAKVTEIPESQSKWSPFTETKEQNRKILRQLIEKDGYEYKGVESDALAKAKMYYQTCRNETATDAAGAVPLLKLIESLGGWSILGNATRSGQEISWNLTQKLAGIHKIRMNPFFTMEVEPDDKNASANIIRLYQSGLSLYVPRNYVKSKTNLYNAYVKHGVTTVTLLRGPYQVTEHAQMEEEMRTRFMEIYEFERKLSKMFVPESKLNDPIASYNKMPLQRFIDMMPEFDLSAYMTELFGREIDTSTEVLVYTPSYFRRLNKVIRETSERLSVDYAMWFMVRRFVRFLSQPFREADWEFKKVLFGGTTPRPLTERCMSEVDDAISFVTGALLVEENASENAKRKTIEMMGGIREAFLENLASLSWMDDKTRAITEDKARAVTEKIGFPDWILDPEKLDEYYAKLSVGTETHLENIVNYLRFKKQHNLKDFGTPVDRGKWSLSPGSVNAEYVASLNQIVFPSGILQPPLFGNDMPMSMNFGAIGMIMAHELIHGFDTFGRQYDKFGRLSDWSWSDSAYMEQADCMVRQYSEYQIQGEHIDGQFTQDENIADSGGLKMAYLAYQKWRQNNTNDLELPLNLTSSQAFFLGMGQAWCSYYTPEHAKLQLQTDPHANEKYRVIGPLSNLPAFSEAFQCPEGSPMNPADKCQVW